MYLADLTRNSFQSGISAKKWLGLCKLLISKTPAIQLEATGEVASNLSNSVLVLYRSYPGDPGLQDYLKAAIQDGLLPLSTFVTTLLQAARSSELHVPSTLDTLCRIALDAHYLSGHSPIGSVVSFSESPVTVLSTVQDALALLRTAYSLPISHFHQLTTSVSELVILLLSCVNDLSQVSTAQALVYFSDVNDVLINFRLQADVRQVLDTFLMSLTLLIGDDVKAAREAQLMHSMQFALGKGDILGPSSDTDITSLGLLLNYIVTYRAHDFGAGDIKNTVALLVTSFRWSSWTPTVFYTQLLSSAFTCLSQSGSGCRLWKAFVVGRLPAILVVFGETINADKSATLDLIGAFHSALTAVFRRPDLIVQCDHALTRDAVSDVILEEEMSRSFSREFLQQLIKRNLVTSQHASQLDPLVTNENVPKWYTEAHDLGLDLAVYLESKIMQDNASDGDVRIWIERIWRDANCHRDFTNSVAKRFASSVVSLDVEPLGLICNILHKYEHALDIVALHDRISDLIFFSLQFLEDYDCETVGDPQSAVTHLGDVVLFVQYTIARYKFENKEITKNNRTVSPGFLIEPPRPSSRLQEDMASSNAWFKALFDSSSEGIEDNILRSTKPKILLRIAYPLFAQAIQATQANKIDKDVLTNGVSYFTGRLLNWTLVGVIKNLFKEIRSRQFAAPRQLEIVQSLILSPSCPKAVLELCSPEIIILVSERKRPQNMVGQFSLNVPAIRQALGDAIGGSGDSFFTTVSGGQIWHQVQYAIQKAVDMARSHKAPFLDVKRCLKTLQPIKFLQLLWSELAIAASLGELEACRRIMTFVLTIPLDSTIPPILPIFLHIVVPSLIANADKQSRPEQTMTMELLVAIISSVLNAVIQLEWAMRSGSGDDYLVLGQSSAGLARRLASDLRRNRGSDVSGMILHRLASSQPFIANFPAFVN